MEDDGVGFKNGAGPSASGLGTIIVNAMSQKLGAAVRFEARQPGTRVSVSFDPTSNHPETPRKLDS